MIVLRATKGLHFIILHFIMSFTFKFIFKNVNMLTVTAVLLSEAELPVTARGQSSGSLRRNMGKKITGDKSEKKIR